MLKPVVDSVIEKAPSRYAMVIGVAKRARDIVEQAQTQGEILVEKPVGIAVDQLMNREYDIIEITDEERLAKAATTENAAVVDSVDEAPEKVPDEEPEEDESEQPDEASEEE